MLHLILIDAPLFQILTLVFAILLEDVCRIIQENCLLQQFIFVFTQKNGGALCLPMISAAMNVKKI